MRVECVENRPRVSAQRLVAVHVDLDDSTATRVELDTYFKVVDELDATAIGHDTGRKAGTSTIFFRSKSPITKREMQEALGPVRVLSVRAVRRLNL